MRTRILLPVIFNARDNVSLWLWTQQGRARSSIRQTRCCGSADGNGITSQTIQTEKAPNVYCWWNAMKFRRLPRGGILQRCATEQQSSVKSHCCLCVRHSESIASLLNRIRPLIFLYIYAFIAIFITLQYRLTRTIFLCNLLFWLSAVQFTWVWLCIYYFTHHFSRLWYFLLSFIFVLRLFFHVTKLLMNKEFLSWATLMCILVKCMNRNKQY